MGLAGRRRHAGQSAFWGADVGPNPTDRATNGTKKSLLVDGQGGPLSAIVAPANRTDATERLLLDKGYDNPEARDTVAAFGYEEHIRPIREERRKRKGGRRKARRWVVERTFAWLSKRRGLLVRYDKNPLNCLDRIQVACALLWYRRWWRLTS